MNNDREAIRALYREYWRCMIAKDADGLRAILAEDYSLLHMTGVQQSAEVFLRGLDFSDDLCYTELALWRFEC